MLTPNTEQHKCTMKMPWGHSPGLQGHIAPHRNVQNFAMAGVIAIQFLHFGSLCEPSNLGFAVFASVSCSFARARSDFKLARNSNPALSVMRDDFNEGVGVISGMLLGFRIVSGHRYRHAIGWQRNQGMKALDQGIWLGLVWLSHPWYQNETMVLLEKE